MTKDEYNVVVAYTKAKAAMDLVDSIPPVRGAVTDEEIQRVSEVVRGWCLALRRRVAEMLDEAGEGARKTEEGGQIASDDNFNGTIESDPSSLASQAAVELDNLVRKRGIRVSAVQRLGELLREENLG